MSLELDIFDLESPNAELCQLYWGFDDEGEFKLSVKQISENFGISSAELLKIVKSNCCAFSTSVFCDCCGEAYVYANRSDYINQQKYNGNITCEDCINEAQQSESLRKKAAIQAIIDNNDYELSVGALTVKQAVFLYALIRHSANENLTGLNEFRLNTSELFSPDKDYSIKVLKELHDQDTILIDPDSELEHITLLENGGFQYYIDRVKWFLPLSNAYKNMNQFISELDNSITSMSFIDDAYEEVVELCKEVSLQECIGYLNFVLSKHQLNFNPGEKTILAINKALERYSVSQVYNFIWRAGRDAAAYYMRSHVPKKQAANTVVGSIERQIERAEANDWEVTAYRRVYSLQQSQVSRVLFNLLLHTDDGGFGLTIDKLL
ncbi:hypothetical protein [Marinicella meishanensis]|uniref:hypothetical protein n=1 Tax=Marinicella meishanensis TaxID=2873263 RepID=UPI001CC02CDA|nr:hypothetical protein [Marinicella sp. NBU2979]